jgi:hypothetical protein
VSNTNLMDWDWPVDVQYSQQQVGRLVVKGLMGVIHKFILVPTYSPDDNGILRVIGWSFVPREQIMRPELLAEIEQKEKDLLAAWKDLNNK